MIKAIQRKEDSKMNNIKNKKPVTRGVAVDINLNKTPILYTDNIFMSVNENGVVLDICQKLGPTNKMRIVSRAGMSREHAKKFVSEFAKLITKTEGQLYTTQKAQGIKN